MEQLREIEVQYHRVRRGEIAEDHAPHAVKAAAHARAKAAAAQDINVHASDYISHLKAAGDTEAHISNTRQRLERLIQLMKISRLDDLTEDRVTKAIKALHSAGLKDRTRFHYVRVWKAFTRWSVKTGRLTSDPLAQLTPPTVTDAAEKTALSVADSWTLIEGVKRLPARFAMTGEERSILYMVAITTGYRRGELASLTRESFRLDLDPPTVDCAAARTKNRSSARQPIPRAVAEVLRPWLATKPPGVPVFHLSQNSATARMLKVDLTALGLPTAGVDFHGLRRTYVTALALSDAPIGVVRTLARHSDIRLTMGLYAKVRPEDGSAYVGRAFNVVRPPTDPAEQAG
jgi:integrase